MSVDTVNQGLTRVRLALQMNWASFSEQGYQQMTSMMEVQRDFLMREDAAGFVSYTQERLAAEPDTMGFILGELFADLLGNEQATWEQFEKELHNA